jgi:hypothetical protein
VQRLLSEAEVLGKEDVQSSCPRSA